MQRYFQFAEKQRWDKKWKFKRREAVTRFTTGKQPKKIIFYDLTRNFNTIIDFILFVRKVSSSLDFNIFSEEDYAL